MMSICCFLMAGTLVLLAVFDEVTTGCTKGIEKKTRKEGNEFEEVTVCIVHGNSFITSNS